MRRSSAHSLMKKLLLPTWVQAPPPRLFPSFIMWPRGPWSTFMAHAHACAHTHARALCTWGARLHVYTCVHMHTRARTREHTHTLPLVCVLTFAPWWALLTCGVKDRLS